jgi:hypothetical protein
MVFYDIYIINYIELLKVGALQIGPIGSVLNQSNQLYPKESAYSVCSIKIIREDGSVAIVYRSILKQIKTIPLPDS